MSEKERIERLEKVVGTLITWIAQSSVGCLSVPDAEALLANLKGDKKSKSEGGE